MIKLLGIIGIPVIATVATIFGVYNYVSLSTLEIFSIQKEPKLGVSITTIQGTDTLKDSRTTINTNFSNLDAGKIENSTTSVAAITTLSNLVSVGTITTGTWDASTLTVARGGTGSTTLSANQVLLGNGTTQLAVVAGLGSSGQFLTSGGAGTPPTWTTGSFDTTLNYTLTGDWVFRGSESFSTSTVIGFKAVAGQYLSAGMPVLIATTTYAAVDPSATLEDTNAPFGATWAQAQSSSESNARLIRSVTLRIGKTGTPTDNVVVALVPDSGANTPATSTINSAFDGPRIASSTLPASAIPASVSSVTFYFFPAVYVPQSERVWIVIDRSGATDASNDYFLRYDSVSLDTNYANGKGMNWNSSQGWTNATVDFAFTMDDIGVTSGYVYAASGGFYTTATSTIGIIDTTVSTSSSANIVVSGVYTSFNNVSPSQYLYLQNGYNSTSTATGTIARPLCWAITTTDCKIIDKR